MRTWRQAGRWWVAAVTVAALGPVVWAAGGGETVPVVRMGMIQSLFRGAEASSKNFVAQAKPLGDMITAPMGLRGDVCVVADPAELARQVEAGELDLAIMHGNEIAWVREQFPEVKPLVLAVNHQIRLRSHLFVKADGPYQKLADLQSKRLALPPRAFNHNYLFLHHSLLDAGLEPTGFFSGAAAVTNMDGALDAVIDGQADLAACDGVAWEAYQDRKPGRAKKLRILATSPVFPTAAVMYNPKRCDPQLARRMYDGLTSAHQTTLGKQMLTLFRMTHFCQVPAEYEQLLRDVVKSYPQPFQPAAFVVAAKVAGRPE